MRSKADMSQLNLPHVTGILSLRYGFYNTYYRRSSHPRRAVSDSDVANGGLADNDAAFGNVAVCKSHVFQDAEHKAYGVITACVSVAS